MYYVTNIIGKKIGIKDTSDGVVDYLKPVEAVLAIRQGLKIVGIYKYRGDIYFTPLNDILAKLLSSAVGTPVLVKLAEGLDFRQSLYVGYKLVASDIIQLDFYDDTGVTGLFSVTNKEVMEDSRIQFNFNCDNQKRISVLKRRLVDIGGV